LRRRAEENEKRGDSIYFLAAGRGGTGEELRVPDGGVGSVFIGRIGRGYSPVICFTRWSCLSAREWKEDDRNRTVKRYGLLREGGRWAGGVLWPAKRRERERPGAIAP
jgi:hypothetical protein